MPRLKIFYHVEIVTERSNIKEITSPNGRNVQTLDLFYFKSDTKLGSLVYLHH